MNISYLDFICLPQYYRTAEEQVFFSKAMANMHVLYAHQAVFQVIRLEKLADDHAKASPPDFIDIYYEAEGAEPGSGKFGPQPFSKLELNDTPYHERGWCEAEKQWMCTKTGIESYAPMTPARLRERIERGHQNLPDGLVLKFTLILSVQPDVVSHQKKTTDQSGPRSCCGVAEPQIASQGSKQSNTCGQIFGSPSCCFGVKANSISSKMIIPPNMFNLLKLDHLASFFYTITA